MKESPKAMEVEKPFVVQRANLRRQTRVTERNNSELPAVYFAVRILFFFAMH